MAIQMTSALVSALFGSSTSSASTPDAVTALATFRRATQEGAEEKGIEQERKDPVSIRAIDQFNKAIEKATDLEEALSDPRILEVLLPALGLAGKQDQGALVRKVLLSDTSDSESLAAQLGGTWESAAETLNLATYGLESLKDPETIALLTEGYLSYQYRTGLDEQGAGVADALYFREKAASVDDVYTILGDTVMRRVVTGALGLPAEIAVQPVETQARAVTARLDLESLQDSGAVEKLIQRYLISQAGSSSSSSSVLSLFA
jgi:hypothetical protein